jgi:hypothetical protein
MVPMVHVYQIGTSKASHIAFTYCNTNWHVYTVYGHTLVPWYHGTMVPVVPWYHGILVHPMVLSIPLGTGMAIPWYSSTVVPMVWPYHGTTRLLYVRTMVTGSTL